MEVLVLLVQETMLIGSLLVVVARNPITAILSFVLVVVQLAVCMILLLAEFIGFSYIVVYCGAICILLLFIVLMLNLRYVELSGRFITYISIGGVVVVLFVACLVWLGIGLTKGPVTLLQTIELNSSTSLSVMGVLLYSEYSQVVIISGFILLLAMLSCIVLTLEHRTLAQNPEVEAQLVRVTNVDLRF